MKKPFAFECEGEELTLEDSVELFALGICENIAIDKEKPQSIMLKCKMLDSLTNALLAVRKQSEKAADNSSEPKDGIDIGSVTEPNDIFKKMEEKGYVLVRKQYFESMSKSFERLFGALTTNSPGNTSKAMRDLKFIRSGFNCKKAEEVSEYLKKRLLLTDEKLKEFAEPTINSIGKD